MSIINSQPRIGAAGQSTGFKIERSLRFNSADSAYLSRTPASAGNRRTWTWSGWVKRSVTGVETNVFVAGPYVSSAFKNFRIRFTSGEALEVYNYDSSYQIQLISSAVYRDPSAWYHIVVAVDTTQATNTNRVKVYVNGVQVTAFGTATYPNQNVDTEINTTEAHYLGFKYGGDGNGWFSGYLTEVHFIDGSALTPSSFGETDTDTGVWKPKAYSGSYGTNGFYLKFADNSGTTSTTLGKDSSGNGNNWTPNNFSVTAGAGNDSLVDTPTPYGTDTGAGGEVRGNYCTLNPLDKGSAIALANGNLDIGSASNPNNNCRGTFGMSSGKWYFEFVVTSAIGGVPTFGIGSDTASLTSNFSGDSYLYLSNGTKAINGVETAYGATFTQNDVIGVAFDADNNSITFYKNNSSQGAITGVTSGLTWRPFVHASITTTITSNFGQRPFAYTAPSGFKALCTQNLPTPTIGATATSRADDYFNTVLYTGDSNSTGATRSVTGVGFQPDFVWLKTRTDPYSHQLYDAVRGTGSSKNLSSDRTAAEGDLASLYGYVSAFQTDGFQTTNGSSGTDSGIWVNALNENFVAWNWKANGAGSSNTSGTITSTVSANTTAGFSIVTYTGTGANATVGHGLGVAPSMVIVKRRNSTSDWAVRHTSIAVGDSIQLNLTTGAATSATVWNSTAPTSTVFSIGTDASVNANTATYVAYCFASVSGYSSFGTYAGNASTDGSFIFTGFRPALVLIKRRDGSDDWYTFDNKRIGYNVRNEPLFPNGSGAEGSGYDYIDLLSNGFKIRNNSFINASGANYLYAAFAEVPQKFSLAR